MGKHRRQRPLGMPEFVGLVLVVAVVVPAWLWWRDVLVGSWQITSGTVVSCDVRTTHYNATDYQPVVTIRYRYTVAGDEYESVWQGMWPEAGGPNALPRNQLKQLQVQGRPLVIYYNPSEPRESSPHDRAPFRQITYASATVLAACVVAWYFVRIFPGLRPR